MPPAVSRNKVLVTAIICFIFLVAVFYKNNNKPIQECQCENNGNEEIPPISKREIHHFPQYLEANEKIRSRFLEKRQKNIFAGRSEYDVALWEHRQGWQYVWNSFIPLFTCPHLVERIGTAKDGGKWVCGIEIFEKPEIVENKDCVIYSLGVGWDSTFEVEMVKRTGCSVYAYDYTVDRMELPSGLEPEVRNRIKFFKLGLGSREQAQTDDRFRTLGQLMNENNHVWIDFLKVDIEGAEFALLSEMNEEFEKIPYGHLNIEIHLNEKASLGAEIEQRKEFRKLYQFWESLENKGLRAWMWEDNYYMCTFGKAPPVVMEYAFINVRDVVRNRLIQF